MPYEPGQKLRQIENLSNFLGRLVSGLQTHEANSAIKFDPDEIFITGEEFDKSKKFIIDPYSKQNGQDVVGGQALTLHTIDQFLTKLYGFIQEKEYFEKYNQLNAVYQEDGRKILENIRQRLAQLPGKSYVLPYEHQSELMGIVYLFQDYVEVLELGAGEPATVTAELSHELPGWLAETARATTAFDVWETIQRATELFEKNNHLGEIGVDLGETQRIEPKFVRDLLNDWLDKLYEEENARPLKNKWKLPPPEDGFLTSKSEAVAFDLLIISESDFAALRFFHKVFDAIEDFLKRPAAEGPAYKNAQKDEDGGGGASELSNTTDEDLVGKIQKITEAGREYRNEALRLRTILLTQFFTIHGIDPREFGVNEKYQIEYGQVQNEITLELERLFRSLTPEELATLGKPKGRLKLLRTLYARLSTNPRFVTYVQVIKEKYVAEIELTDPGKATELRRRIGLVSERIVGVISDNADLERELKTSIEALNVTAKLNLRLSSKTDFENIFRVLGFDAGDQEKIFSSADVIMFMRLTPERLRHLDPNQFERIFGFSPKNINFEQFGAVLAEYLYMRRERFAELYGKDSLTHFTDNDQERTAPLSDGELRRVEYFRGKVGDEKNGFSSRSLATAAALTPDEIARLREEEHENVTEVEKAYQFLLSERAKDFAKLLYENKLFDQYQREAAFEQVGIYQRDLPPESSQLSDRQIRLIQKYLANNEERDFSYYDSQDGLVTDQHGPNRRALARPNFSPMGPRVGVGGFARNVADKGAEALGASVLNAVAPGLGMVVGKKVNKTVGYAGGAVAAGIVSALFTLASNVFVGALAALGGIAGFLIGGPVLGVVGAFAGGGIGLFAEKSGLFNGLFGGGGASSAATTAASTSTPLLAPGAAPLTAALSSPAMAVPVFAAITAVGALATQLALNGALLPPLPTLGLNGELSKYVVITKSAVPAREGMIFTEEKDPFPVTLTYSIKIMAQAHYKITITHITDVFTTHFNETERKKVGITSQGVPKDSPINDQSLAGKPTTLNGDGTDNTLEFSPYTATFDKQFTDSNVVNTVTIHFTATDANGTAIQENGSPDLTAQTAEVVCFGKCPQNQNGCWPASGFIAQDPFGAYDHRDNGEDAFDIANNFNTPVYATYGETGDGTTACGFSNPGGYGNGLYLNVAANSDHPAFTMTYGHLNAYEDGITNNTENTCVDVVAGTLIGRMGSTGHSTGPHLHYQYGPEKNPGPSILVHMVPPDENGKPASADITSPVRSCYDVAQ